MTDKFDVDVDHYVKRAKELVGDKMQDVDVERIVRQAYELTRPRTDEELAELERKEKESWEKFKQQQKESNRRYALHLASKIQQNHRPKRFFGIKIGWWY